MLEMKKALAVTLCLIISFNCFGFTFGIDDSTTRETLEGKETETPFILASKENLISFIKIERADGKKEYYLSCTEYTDGYYPITLRLGIDGNIETFFEKSPVYNGRSNRARWKLSDTVLQSLRSCKVLAIEFDGKVYRFTGDKLVIENYMGFPGEKKEYENPAAQIREFLK